MKKIIAGLITGFLCLNVFSQNILVNNFIRLRPINDDGEIVLEDLSIQVQVTGKTAETKLDMIFTNTSTRVLEGEFEFPLAEGQSVIGYSIDMNGKMREGVVVEKDKGRQVFEAVERKKVDPGLIETTRGNNYKTRIFPFNAKGSRHVQIIYEEEVTDKYFMAPLCEKPVKNFSFDFKIVNPSEKTITSSLNLSNWNKGYNINLKEKNFSFKEPIQIVFPEDTPKNGAFITTEGTNSYFYYFDSIQANTITKKTVENLAVFFDVSNSAKKRDIEKETAFLLKYISQNVKPEGKVEILPFNNLLQNRCSFLASQTAEIEACIKGFVFDGATCFDCIREGNCINTPDEVLIFSDGINNWGVLGENKFTASVNTICTSPSSDYNFLKSFAIDNKGQFINLLKVSEEQALEILKQEPFRLLSVKYDDQEVKEVYPKPGAIVSSSFSLSGILMSKLGKIDLEFGYGSEITKQVSFTLDATEAKDGPQNLPRLWAEKKIDSLSGKFAENKAEIIELSKAFKVVTSETSLIVLDSVLDYVKYGIIPPADLLEEYNNVVHSTLKDLGDIEEIPHDVILNFEKFKKWWETTPEEFKKNVQKQKTFTARENSQGAFAVRNSPSDNVVVKREASARASDMMEDTQWDDEDGRAPLAEPRLSLNKDNSEEDRAAVIQMQAWNPKTDYLTALKKTKTNEMYAVYLEYKKEYEDSPSFYMDVADYFNSEKFYGTALTILSNLAEMNLENTDILRALGNKLVEWGFNDDAVIVFEKLTVLRPEIPQFFRDLGLAYNEVKQYQKAADTLYHVASKRWDSRYSEIQQIVLNDMNAIIAAHPKQVDVSKYDSRILQNFPVDIRIVLTWNTDNCDIDLWTFDPNNEKCFYSHKLTEIGGHNSRDFTQGYGPEEFCLRKAVQGEYKIYADYYGTQSQKLLQPVVVQAEVYTNFGTSKQKKQILTLQLETVKGNYQVGTIKF